MAEPFNRLRSKLNRAIAAYLLNPNAYLAVPDASLVPCGAKDDILPANAITPNTYPNTTVQATLSKVEVPLTGLRRISVHLSIKGSAVQEVGEPNPEQKRVEFDQRIANTYDALMQSDDGQSLRATARAITAAGRALAVPVDNTAAALQLAANNADMADFTCQAWFDSGEGDGMANAEGCSWEEILMFEALCSASNTD